MVSNVGRRGTGETVSGVPGGLRAVIAALVPGLRPSDAKVLRLVLDDPAFVQSATTDEVARRAGVSPATVVRAARSSGFQGFSELKLALAQAAVHETNTEAPTPLAGDSTVEHICEAVLASHAGSIRSARATLDADALRRAVSLLSSAREIVVFGVGTSAAPAIDAAYRWTTIGCRAQAPRDTRSAQLQARQLDRHDVLVAISHTGASTETLAVVGAATAAGASVITITSFAASPLAERADALLVAGGPDLGLHMAASSSRLAHLAVVDVLHAGVGLADLRRTRHALDLTMEITEARSV
jgi:DNA-binding MurR/RpiR family transcriptional regulator